MFTEKGWSGKRSKMTATVQITTILMTEAEIRSAAVCTDRGGEFLPLQWPRDPNAATRGRAGTCLNVFMLQKGPPGALQAQLVLCSVLLFCS